MRPGLGSCRVRLGKRGIRAGGGGICRHPGESGAARSAGTGAEPEGEGRVRAPHDQPAVERAAGVQERRVQALPARRGARRRRRAVRTAGGDAASDIALGRYASCSAVAVHCSRACHGSPCLTRRRDRAGRARPASTSPMPCSAVLGHNVHHLLRPYAALPCRASRPSPRAQARRVRERRAAGGRTQADRPRPNQGQPYLGRA